MEGIFTSLLMMAAVLGLYFLPSIIAARRGKKNTASIVIVNFFFGWTILGWVICLAWAFMHEGQKE